MKQVNNLYLETKEAHMRDTLQSSPLKSLQWMMKDGSKKSII